MVVKRGDIFYADLSPVVGSEQGGIRPVLIIQNLSKKNMEKVVSVYRFQEGSMLSGMMN